MAVGARLRLAARTVSNAGRTREWILVVEGLLAGAAGRTRETILSTLSRRYSLFVPV